jgi:hypothetical protein
VVSQHKTLMRFYSLDEGFKSSSYLTETLLDPQLGHAFESNKTAFNKAYNVEKELWTWYEAPENRLRLARFGAGMSGVKNVSSPDAILTGSILLRNFCTSLSHLETSDWQGTAGESFLRARWLSMSEAVSARSPCCSLSITQISASLSRTASLSWAMQSRYVYLIQLPRQKYGVFLRLTIN